MPKLARNYENPNDHWGYSTICDKCKEKIEKGFRTKYEKGINFSKVLTSFPIAECNSCGKKVEHHDN